MKRTAVLVLVGVVILVIGFVVGTQVQASRTAQSAVQNGVNAGDGGGEAGASGMLAASKASPGQGGDLAVDARVVPVHQAELSFPVSGIVAEVLAREGESVDEGQALIRLNSSQQETGVSRAEADLRKARAEYDMLKAGARTQEIESAEALLAAAQARLGRIQNGALPGEIAAAQAGLASAEAALAKVLEGSSEQEIIVARADLANAEAALSQTQSAFDKVKWRNDVGALPESAALQQASNNYAAAQARWQDLQDQPSSADIDRVSADVERARVELEQLRATLPADVSAAEADVRQYQAQLDLLRAGARSEELAVAEAEIAAATATLQQALVALAETEFRAPFAGTVALLESNPGEQVSPGARLIRLADLSNWEIRTEDLTELQIDGIGPGERVEVTFDALPDLMMPAKVARVRPIGGNQRGDIVYTVVVEPDGSDERLLWNMTAVVKFEDR